MTSRLEPEGSSAWSYDQYANGSPCAYGKGKLCESSTQNGVDHKVAYDNFGRPLNGLTTASGSAFTTTASFATAVSYDATTGQVTGQTYPTGLQVGYTYTPLGYLQQLNLATAVTVNASLPSTGSNSGITSTGQTQGVALPANSALWTAQAMDAWGKLEQQQYGNRVQTNSTFDATRGRLTDVVAGASGTVLSQHYIWNGVNQLLERTDDNGDTSSGVSTGAVQENFGYDSLNRLTSYDLIAPGMTDQGRTVNLQYNALGMLLYKSDVGNYSYNAQGTAQPHALQSVAGVGSSATTYQYDANGNMVTASAGKYSGITYTSFNLPESQNGIVGPTGTRYTWTYDENHQRIQEIRTDASGIRKIWYQHPDNQGSLGFESEVEPDGVTISNRHFLMAGGQTIGVLVSTGALPAVSAGQMAPSVFSSNPSLVLVKVEYWHLDHLGSVTTTTDQTGAVTERYAYDPFGKRRYVNGSYDANGALVADWSSTQNWGTGRGFTGHEQLDEVGLVHMNGRIFDPTLGVFLQADPMMQNPLNLQNFNRYAYCYNNPLTCTDPSGEQDAPTGGDYGDDGSNGLAGLDSSPTNTIDVLASGTDNQLPPANADGTILDASVITVSGVQNPWYIRFYEAVTGIFSSDNGDIDSGSPTTYASVNSGGSFSGGPTGYFPPTGGVYVSTRLQLLNEERLGSGGLMSPGQTGETPDERIVENHLLWMQQQVAAGKMNPQVAVAISMATTSGSFGGSEQDPEFAGGAAPEGAASIRQMMRAPMAAEAAAVNMQAVQSAARNLGINLNSIVVNGGVAKMTIGLTNRMSFSDVKVLASYAESVGATSVEVNSGYLGNLKLNAFLQSYAQSGRPLYGGIVTPNGNSTGDYIIKFSVGK